jgi:hypothetical protein
MKTMEDLRETVGVPVEIRNKFLPNSSLELYRYIILLGSIFLCASVHVRMHVCLYICIYPLLSLLNNAKS